MLHRTFFFNVFYSAHIRNVTTNEWNSFPSRKPYGMQPQKGICVLCVMISPLPSHVSYRFTGQREWSAVCEPLDSQEGLRQGSLSKSLQCFSDKHKWDSSEKAFVFRIHNSSGVNIYLGKQLALRDGLCIKM